VDIFIPELSRVFQFRDVDAAHEPFIITTENNADTEANLSGHEEPPPSRGIVPLAVSSMSRWSPGGKMCNLALLSDVLPSSGDRSTHPQFLHAIGIVILASLLRFVNIRESGVVSVDTGDD